MEERSCAELRYRGKASVVRGGEFRLVFQCGGWRWRAEGLYLTLHSLLTFSDSKTSPVNITQAAFCYKFRPAENHR